MSPVEIQPDDYNEDDEAVTDAELDLVSSNALVAALRRRSEGSIVALVKNLDGDNELIEVFVGGGEGVALGLAARVEAQLRARLEG